MATARVLVLFPDEWDRSALAAPGLAARHRFEFAGFDLFNARENPRLLTFGARRFLDRLERRYRRTGLDAVVSNHELWGSPLAAELAQRLGLAGPSPEAILTAQHKHRARRVLEQHVPSSIPRFSAFSHTVRRTDEIGLPFPLLVKPVKSTFSILARRVESFAELARHLRFGLFERFLLRRLVGPFEELRRERLPAEVSAYSFLAEEWVEGRQVNVDGYVFRGQVHILGVVDALMYPGTFAFRCFEYPSSLPPEAQRTVRELSERVIHGLGLDHGFFNVELLVRPDGQAPMVIEVNPRLAYQLADLYRRVDGFDLHAAQLALALGEQPRIEAATSTTRVAASFVYRRFDGRTHDRWPAPLELERLRALEPDARLALYPRRPAEVKRDMRWLGSYRYALLHLSGESREDLLARERRISPMLGLRAAAPEGDRPAAAPEALLSSSGVP